MKGSNTEVQVKYDPYEHDWRVGFLRFVLGILKFTITGGVGGDSKWHSDYYKSKKYKWVEDTD